MKTGRKGSAAAPPVKPHAAPNADSLRETVFLLAAGVWIGLSLLKFGNPVIFGAIIPPPANFAEFLFVAWPIRWGYVLVGLVVLASLAVLKPELKKEHWPIFLLFGWLFWQFLSASHTIDKRLSNPTLVHFVSCVVALLIGFWALARTRVGPAFWIPVLGGLFYVLFTGLDQHNGGLEAVRKQFYATPGWELYPKEYILKVQSNRIFSTLVYPNALAGVLLLLLPISLWKSWQLALRWPRVARGVLVGLFGYLGLACLFWTGSKGGWLIALGMAAVGLLHFPFPRRVKVALVAAGLTIGLVAFFVRFSAYFQKGATSVGARFTYWSAAVQTAREHPFLGSGPGTFSEAYKKIKPPDAEMARLTHNDYLEQASDSGLPGALLFMGFVATSLFQLYRKVAGRGWGFLLLWIGLLGWAAQALIEFSLYIPALSWPAFLFLGWLWGLEEEKGAFVES